MQLATASYACPDLGLTQADAAAATTAGTDQVMADCEGMDTSQPGLCHAHSQAGKQSLDKAQLPHAPSFVAIGPATIAYSTDAVHRFIVAQPESGLLARTTAPPLSIRNCCFRI